MLWQGFEIKSYQRRAHYIYPLRNGRQLAGRGAPGDPPQSDWGKRGWNDGADKMFPFA